MSAMTRSLVDRLVPAELWALVEPLLPPAPRHGRRRVVPDRNCFAALVFMGRTPPLGRCPPVSLAAAVRRPRGGGWRNGSAPGYSTSSAWCCWTGSARPAASTLAGSASTRPACARAKGGAPGATPVDRGKLGSKLHLAGDNGVGAPLVVLLTAANIPDGVLVEALVDDLPAIRMPSGRRRRRPGKLQGDKAYDSRATAGCRESVGSGADRQAGGGVVAVAWAGAVKGRAHDRLGVWVPAVADALGAQRRSLLRVRAAGVLAAQLLRPPAATMVILGVSFATSEQEPAHAIGPP